ncbi:MAG: hypothetical protein EAZ28_32940 [Oscillatoriales cyanobacterium]|nr:MAG: hypothetical protein EAZ28_32940 [Oscillatoriales cyanobacterium]
MNALRNGSHIDRIELMVDTGYIIITITCKKQKPGMKINQLIREFSSGLLIVNRSGASGARKRAKHDRI